MKIDQLALALTLVSAALFTCVLAILVLQIGSNLPPDYTWSDIASDWGAIIGALIALLAAAITVSAMNAQSATVRAIEEQRVARQVAANIRSFERHARALHDELIVYATLAFNNYKRRVRGNWPNANFTPLPDFDCGLLPDLLRQHVSASLIGIDRVCRTLRNGDLTKQIIEDEKVHRLTKWHEIEVHWLIGLVHMERYAQLIEREGRLVPVPEGSPEDTADFQRVAREMRWKLGLDDYAKENNLDIAPTERTTKYVTLLRGPRETSAAS